MHGLLKNMSGHILKEFGYGLYILASFAKGILLLLIHLLEPQCGSFSAVSNGETLLLIGIVLRPGALWM
jgi:hypothetical protein